MTNQEVQKMLKQQHEITTFEIATICAEICEANKGVLFVGDIIRNHFKLKNLEKKIPKLDPPLTPVVDPPKEVKPVEKPKSILTRIK